MLQAGVKGNTGAPAAAAPFGQVQPQAPSIFNPTPQASSPFVSSPAFAQPTSAAPFGQTAGSFFGSGTSTPAFSGMTMPPAMSSVLLPASVFNWRMHASHKAQLIRTVGKASRELACSLKECFGASCFFIMQSLGHGKPRLCDRSQQGCAH